MFVVCTNAWAGGMGSMEHKKKKHVMFAINQAVKKLEFDRI